MGLFKVEITPEMQNIINDCVENYQQYILKEEWDKIIPFLVRDHLREKDVYNSWHTFANLFYKLRLTILSTGLQVLYASEKHIYVYKVPETSFGVYFDLNTEEFRETPNNSSFEVVMSSTPDEVAQLINSSNHNYEQQTILNDKKILVMNLPQNKYSGCYLILKGEENVK